MKKNIVVTPARKRMNYAYIFDTYFVSSLVTLIEILQLSRKLFTILTSTLASYSHAYLIKLIHLFWIMEY